MLGVLLGLAVGIIPGIGGTTGFALVLPFIFHFDATAAIALLIGVAAVTVTSDTITCVLLSIPGSGGSVATIIDGHPMARKGEAHRALSAAFVASMAGGLLGALLLIGIGMFSKTENEKSNRARRRLSLSTSSGPVANHEDKRRRRTRRGGRRHEQR